MESLKSVSPPYNPVYSAVQENLIKSEFPRLKDQCYLEHAGATLYSEKQISNVLSELTENVFGNPHARNVSSKLTEDTIDQIRYQILQHFNTQPEHYSVVFTSGATAALKLVAETFQYKTEHAEEGIFVYLEDNHTSVLGMREYTKKSKSLSHATAFEVLSNDNEYVNKPPKNINSLFVYPAQCNFSGTKYPLSWIERIQKGALNTQNTENSPSNWFCMLDAASYVSTNFLDLSKYKPDFVSISFYKIFGYPTGLGALLIKTSSAHVLQKKYFGGGTVLMALSTERTHIPRKVLHELFEDGTAPFLAIIALRHGFETLKRLSLPITDISQHTFNLARYTYRSLLSLHHGNGEPAVILYHDTNFEDINYQGGIINFNLVRSTGEYIGYAEVLHLSNLYGIHLRTGCFCNPGACKRHLGLTSDDIKHHFNSGHVCGDQNDLIDGHPTGSVRISFGYMSAKKDADTFLNMIEDCFVSKPIIRKVPKAWKSIQERAYKTFKTTLGSKTNDPVKTNRDRWSNIILPANNYLQKYDVNSNFNQDGVLEQIFIYPIKSCAAFQINEGWKLTTTGFKYDRQWMIINANGVCVTQKHDSHLCLIKPIIDLNQNLLELNYEGLPTITIPLNVSTNDENSVWSSKCQSKVCGDNIQGWDCGNDVANWLSDALGMPGLRLLRQCNNKNEASRSSKHEKKPQLSLTNQAQFLLINTASVQWLMNCIPESDFARNLQGLIHRFRPNFVVNFKQPFTENGCSQIRIGNLLFNCDGQCTRCQMICVDQSTGEKSAEPLKTLSKECNGKISFGMYLSNTSSKYDGRLYVKDPVIGISTCN